MSQNYSTKSNGTIIRGNHLILALYMMCTSLYGCSTMQIPDYPQVAAASLVNAATKEGLCIGARALTNKADLEQYFGTDLTELKVLPVYIVAENTNLSTSFLLSKDQVSLVHAKTGDTAASGDSAVTGDSTAAVVYTVLGTITTPLLVFPAMKANSDATVIKHNILVKALQTRTISPGKSVNGFLYFTLPGEMTSIANWAVSLRVKELGCDLTHDFKLNLE